MQLSFFYDKEIIKTVSKRSGLAENYDLCLNSSKLGIDGCVELILDCCRYKGEN